MNADAVELRVLGCLVEKQRTTPDSHPADGGAEPHLAAVRTPRPERLDELDRRLDLLEREVAALGSRLPSA